MIGLKRRSGLFGLLVLVTLTVFFWTFVTPHQAIAQQKIQIPAGTSVLLKTNTTLTPKELNVGDTVELSVVSDVIVDGVVVIKAGASARGEVVASKDRGMIGIAAELGLTVRSVQAVDGTTVALSGSKMVEGKDRMVLSIGLALVCCLLFALMKGGDANIPAGTQIQSTVAGTTTVTAQ
jgi:hypothetical protein